MLQLKDIKKIYGEKGKEQVEALKGVSLEFRENEFVSILGQSGCGKTTFLNIIGGLDKYTSGDLIINGKSTKKFKDRDWDTYRNHSVGFVFQSYNLISHQSILNNVELALTLAGMGKKERRKKAIEALKQVGLEDKIHKKPTELSGGQMQRVAIARALVGNPDILLADEPTGALDSATSIQIMDLLKDIAKNRLVIMVTHNPELAEKYSTRIIKLLDGSVVDDSNPYSASKEEVEKTKSKTVKTKKTYMKFTTALSLSFKNLLTKKGRTILTAFAGSIGIIGIALILSLSNGMQEYINKVQRETLSAYPLSVDATSIDLTSLIEQSQETNMNSRKKKDNVEVEQGKITSKDDITNNVSLTMQSSIIKNNLAEFKKYLDDNGGNVKDYTSAIQYSYDLELQIYSPNTENEIVKLNPNPISMTTTDINQTATVGSSPYSQVQSSMMVTDTTEKNVFTELLDSKELLNSQYEILDGKMPENYNEVVLIVDENGQIPESVLYALNVKQRDELEKIKEQISNDEEVNVETTTYNYNDFIGQKYKLVLSSDYYENEKGTWKDKSEDSKYMKNVIDNATDLEVVGILKINPEATTAMSGVVGYTHNLTKYVIEKSNESEIVKEQLANKDIDVVTKLNFEALKQTGMTLETNLAKLGYVDIDSPASINIYPKDFNSKEQIEDIIEDYNNQKKDSGEDEYVISYTDYVGLMMSSITTIIDTITYVLIAFVAISLVVSSIMIAIITYISVLERTKEIGILRSIGASKKDVSRVFNAETVIEGLIAGLLGVGITLLLCVPINVILKSLLNVSNIAALPVTGGIGLILLSVILTVVAGIIPSRMASKRDPAVALRSE